MTYFGFLARFLLVPIVLLAAVQWRDARRGRALPASLGHLAWWHALAGIIVVALLYTTPWDNYLVATRVWWYDPSLVTGLTIGWVPIEEYTFFVLQPLLAGLLFFSLARRVPVEPDSAVAPRTIRILPPLLLGAVTMAASGVLLLGWNPGTYLALELVWALPPIIFQMAFGGDIIWRARRPVALAVLISTLYLSATDAVAIAAGTWTIDPAQSLRIYLGGVLPLEEFIFFLLTSVLCVFGTTLVIARASRARLPALGRHERQAQPGSS